MKKVISFLLSCIILLTFALPAFAEEAAVEIENYEDLLEIAENPSGSYILTKDIDCAGNVWTPVDFTGTFDGNDFAIMNAKIEAVSKEVRTTIDGNWKQYDTYFSGFFGTLEKATVKNVTFLGIDVDVTNNDNTYVGTIAGYIADSKIENCTVSGKASLTSACKSFGVGGIIGYGNGQVDKCTADVTLICVDTDKENRDEQFLGGAYANGYPDITNCTINIAGYTSDHGYVHDGGIGGMYILPGGVKYKGHVDNNTVTGFISFFEDNTNRRAYCVGDIGEIMSWTLTKDGNDIKGFERKETKDYSKDLYPDMCATKDYDTVVTEPTDGEYGYTTYTCKECGYSYKADYTSLNVYVEPEETTEAPQETATKNKDENVRLNIVPIAIMVAVVLVGLIAVAVILNKRKKSRYVPKRGRK